MSEISEELGEKLERRRRSTYWQRRTEGIYDQNDPAVSLLRRLENDPEAVFEQQHEFRWHEVLSAVWLAKMEYRVLSSVWWEYYFEELPNVRRAVYRWQYPERKEVHYYPPYLGGQVMEEAAPDENNPIPEMADYLAWHTEMADLLDKAMAIWDVGERLLIASILDSDWSEGDTPPPEEMTKRERILARLAERMQPVYDREMKQLLSELFDPAAAVEEYLSSYIAFKHLFNTYGTQICIDTVWDRTVDWDQYTIRMVQTYENIDKFLEASLRLSESKMRLVRQAENHPGILEQASQATTEIDDNFQRDDDLFLGKLF